MQVTLIVVLGILSDWCFCAITDGRPPRDLPPFLLRFIEFVKFPGESLLSGWYELAGRAARGDRGLQLFFVFGLICWFVALLVLVHVMALAARVRIGGDGRGARVRLVPLEQVRAWKMRLLTCVLLGAGMAYGAMARQRWLTEAEQVFAATMAAASTGRPLPAGVVFSMLERRGREDVYVNPGPRFVVDVDPHVAGDHVLDRFVLPYEYGGWVRFPSGARHEFTVWHERLTGGWNVALYDENLFIPERRRSSR